MRRNVVGALLVGVLLSACQVSQVVETSTPIGGDTPAVQPTAAVVKTKTPMPTLEPTVVPGMAIYLAEGNLTPADLVSTGVSTEDRTLPLEEIPLQATPLLTQADVVTYNAETHVFTLTAEGTARLVELKVPVAGPVFVMTVAGERIYAGAFWTPLSSLSYDGVVIMMMPDGRPMGEAYSVDLGYPGPGFFQGDDPRGDERVLEALASAGKLAP